MKKVRDFMTRDLTSVTEETKLKDVAELLSMRALSGVPVVDHENRVVGYISEKDVILSMFPEKVKIENPDVIGLTNLTQVINRLGRVGDAKVADYMDKNIHIVSEGTSTSDLAEIMLQKDLKRVPVVRNRRLVGIVDRSSLSCILLEENGMEGVCR
ncbi:MAG: CBS domain-containing protein [Candidatus Saganbacteria bacterium]|nr:CBS domain-containing protein [Candidatus Saganbacteria bacterium]